MRLDPYVSKPLQLDLRLNAQDVGIDDSITYITDQVLLPNNLRTIGSNVDIGSLL